MVAAAGYILLTTPDEITLGPFAGLPSNPNVTGGKHWSTNHKENQEWKNLIGYTALAAKAKNRLRPLGRATIHIHISVGDNRVHDSDNLVASMKYPIDGLKGILIEDDSIDHIGIPTYTVDRAKPRQFTITVKPA